MAEERKASSTPERAAWAARLGAWQPFTGAGVARFASASFGRLLFLQIIGAILSALGILWALQTGYVPVIDRALTQLPDRARIQRGGLVWPTAEAVTLADSPQFAIAVRPTVAAEPDRTADLRLELNPRSARLGGILGYHEWPYPETANWSLGRQEASALWSAWRWPLRFLISVAAAAATLLAWWSVQTALSPFLWAAGAVFRRDLPLAGAWKMAGAACLAAAAAIHVVILLYSRRGLALPGLAAALSAALVATVALVVWALAALPGRSKPAIKEKPNPFASKSRAPAEEKEKEKEKPDKLSAKKAKTQPAAAESSE